VIFAVEILAQISGLKWIAGVDRWSVFAIGMRGIHVFWDRYPQNFPHGSLTLLWQLKLISEKRSGAEFSVCASRGEGPQTCSKS